MLTMLNKIIQELYELYKETEDKETRDLIQKQIDQILSSQAQQ